MPRVRRVRGEALLALTLLNIFVLVTGVVALDVLEAGPLPSTPHPVTDAKGAASVESAVSSPADPERIADALDDPMSESGLEEGLSGFVVDGMTGEPLFDRDAESPAVPASTTKIVTAVAALSVLGPDHVLSTEVYLEPEADRIVLRGSGDAMLTTDTDPESYPRRATLEELAERTAEALAEEEITSVSLGYDDSLFTGLETGPGWKPNYVTEGSTAPVHALLIDGGRVDPDVSTRAPDPPLAAAEAFIQKLEEAGVSVEGDPAKTQISGEAIAKVDSPPVSTLVEFMMLASDNNMAESLGRALALEKGEEASFDGAAEATQHVMDELRIEGVQIFDNSGLSTKNRITPRALVELVELAGDPEHPELNATVTGLPTAHSTGTLAGRYSEFSPAHGGAGLVRGKTGTLEDVSSLAGTVHDQEGNVFVYAFMANTPGADGPQLDLLAATLSRCGCS